MVSASPSSQQPQTLEQLTAEAHRLYALLVPQGRVQVIVPPDERKKLEAQYHDVCARLTAAQAAQKADRAKAQEWVQEVEDALPSLVEMLPGEWKPRVQALAAMPAGQARDDELRKVMNEVLQGDALNRLGPLGIAVRPMLSKFLRRKKA